MTTNFEGSARAHAPRWLSRLTGSEPRPSREEIERDAAAELAIQEQPSDAQAEEVPSEPLGEPAVVATGGDVRQRGRVFGWVRNLVETEPATVRRERLEREAAAELGLHDRSEQPVG